MEVVARGTSDGETLLAFDVADDKSFLAAWVQAFEAPE
jgi:hypothetical protein